VCYTIWAVNFAMKAIEKFAPRIRWVADLEKAKPGKPFYKQAFQFFFLIISYIIRLRPLACHPSPPFAITLTLPCTYKACLFLLFL
jgi:hypothetical protein